MSYKPLFEFHYAVKIKNSYYTGCAGGKWLSQHKSDAFTYTEEGAHAKIDRMNWAMIGATVERVL